MWQIIFFYLCFLSFISRAEEYRKLRPVNDMAFILHNVKINFQFRYRDDLRFSVHHEMFAEAVDGSINQIPVRSPEFLGRNAFIQRLAKDTQQKVIWHKQFLKQRFYSNLFVLDYEEQFFPKAPIIIDLKGTKILNKRGREGLQERFYWDQNTHKL